MTAGVDGEVGGGIAVVRPLLRLVGRGLGCRVVAVGVTVNGGEVGGHRSGKGGAIQRPGFWNHFLNIVAYTLRGKSHK